jgi:sec-independent protein translocase protein TatB
MFDFGLSEILLVAVIAIIFLGPEKLPEVMLNIAKFFKKIKGFLTDAKSSIDKELQIQELKDEANRYKQDLLSASQQLEELSNREIKEPINEEVREIKKFDKEVKRETVSFKKSATESPLDKKLQERREG